MKSAVILAAGRGTRLRSVVRNVPKGLLTIGGRTLIDQSVSQLRNAGIDEVVIVTGYCAEQYENFASESGGYVRTVHNSEFADSGSMYSLYCARSAVEPPFLLLESDLIYEPRAITTLLEDTAAEAILISGPTEAGDEVFVATEDGMLHSMSKNPATLTAPIAGELVGITKISDRLFREMISISEKAFEKSRHFDYETDCLVAAGRKIPIHCPLVENLLWAEIDDESHYHRACKSVYPAIVANKS